MIDAETIFRKGCKCEAAPNRGVKQTEKSGSHRVFGRFSALKQKMSGKTGWFCYAKKSGCDILYQKMKSKNVSLAVEIYPREGTETYFVCLPAPDMGVEIYPREGIETRDVKTIKSSFFPNLNDKFNPKGLYKKGKMC